MVSRIRAYIRENRMIEPKDRVLAGLSGGADSVCLLFVLLELRRELDFELFCVHVNHNLRGKKVPGTRLLSGNSAGRRECLWCAAAAGCGSGQKRKAEAGRRWGASAATRLSGR